MPEEKALVIYADPYFEPELSKILSEYQKKHAGFKYELNIRDNASSTKFLKFGAPMDLFFGIDSTTLDTFRLKKQILDYTSFGKDSLVLVEAKKVTEITRNCIIYPNDEMAMTWLLRSAKFGSEKCAIYAHFRKVQIDYLLHGFSRYAIWYGKESEKHSANVNEIQTIARFEKIFFIARSKTGKNPELAKEFMLFYLKRVE